jgi:hypothetical protein
VKRLDLPRLVLSLELPKIQIMQLLQCLNIFAHLAPQKGWNHRRPINRLPVAKKSRPQRFDFARRQTLPTVFSRARG